VTVPDVEVSAASVSASLHSKLVYESPCPNGNLGVGSMFDTPVGPPSGGAR
jgi:hypothetical protein